MRNLDEIVRQANLTLSLYEETKSDKKIRSEIEKLKRESDAYLHILQELSRIEKTIEIRHLKQIAESGTLKKRPKNFFISMLRANLLGE
ncbi:hypothetical protein HA050_11310 [Iodobacter sp. HSC-16F04]|uniref:Uncharacterized protein n=1 Tax=Iodobacter violaceini TaxID=3044271 RepID=A0ABX0KQ58_9NEIS|nr:hypothetical protein [Iodobacter violacea]NHQ86705.1 hypothetical protein [Iodobacter violacea]